jgi:hypothetical protein
MFLKIASTSRLKSRYADIFLLGIRNDKVGMFLNKTSGKTRVVTRVVAARRKITRHP